MITLRVSFRRFCKDVRLESPFKASSSKITYVKVPPAAAEKFGKRFTEAEIANFIDPAKSFESDKYENVKSVADLKPKVDYSQEKYAFELNTPEMNGNKEEFGFKVKDGREPTLHGDWSHKGRCTDF